jgi:hypothetical protein
MNQKQEFDGLEEMRRNERRIKQKKIELHQKINKLDAMKAEMFVEDQKKLDLAKQLELHESEMKRYQS